MHPVMASSTDSTSAPSDLVLHLATVDFSVRTLLLPQLVFLQEAGYNVATASNPGPDAKVAEDAGICYLPVPMDRSLITFRHFRSLIELVRLLRRNRVHLLHVHTPVAATLGRVAAKLARTPVVFYTAHGFYFHDATPKRFRVPLVLIERVLGKITNHTFTQSDEDRQTAIEEGIALPDKVSYLGNGVDTEVFAQAAARRDAVREELGVGDRVLVAFTGRFVREKGIAELLEAVSVLRSRGSELLLLIIGGSLPSDRDPAGAHMAQTVAELNIADIITTTGVTKRVPDYLAACDIFVLPSYREGMPRSILEAMAAGKPVVATDIRGCREEVVEGVTGYLVPARDSQRLAEAIGTLAGDEGLRARMGAAGQARAREMFDERLVFQRLLEVYGKYLPAKAETRSTTAAARGVPADGYGSPVPDGGVVYGANA